jgi:hypothetical protein
LVNRRLSHSSMRVRDFASAPRARVHRAAGCRVGGTG